MCFLLIAQRNWSVEIEFLIGRFYVAVFDAWMSLHKNPFFIDMTPNGKGYPDIYSLIYQLGSKGQDGRCEIVIQLNYNISNINILMADAEIVIHVQLNFDISTSISRWQMLKL